MSHWQVADLFGRRARPSLQLSVCPILDDGGGSIKVMLHNLGRGAARGTYLLLQNVPNMHLPHYFNGPLPWKTGVTGWTMFAHDLQELVYPGVTLDFIALQHLVRASVPDQVVLNYRLGAADVAEVSGSFQLDFRTGSVWPPQGSQDWSELA